MLLNLFKVLDIIEKYWLQQPIKSCPSGSTEQHLKTSIDYNANNNNKMVF